MLDREKERIEVSIEGIERAVQRQKAPTKIMKKKFAFHPKKVCKKPPSKGAKITALLTQTNIKVSILGFFAERLLTRTLELAPPKDCKKRPKIKG